MKRGLRYVAMQRGDKTYVLDTPCKRGHISARNIDGGCKECKRENERKRIDADRVKYNSRKRKERSAHNKEIAAKMRVTRSLESAEKRIIRLEKARVKQVEWRKNNPDHEGSKLAKKAYKLANPWKGSADNAKRRAAFLERTPAWLEEDDFWLIEQVYALASLRSKMLGFTWCVDHIIPLKGKLVSGLHIPINLQVIPEIDNLRKSNKFIPA